MEIRILALENEKNWQRVLESVLGAKYKLNVAQNIPEAKDFLAQSHYALVLVNINLMNMPEMPDDQLGFEFLEFLQQYYPAIPKIVITGTHKGPIFSTFTPLGVADVLIKGQFAGFHLLKVVENVISRRLEKRQNDEQISTLHQEEKILQDYRPRVVNIPFRIGSPIDNPHDFIGRVDVLQDITNALNRLQNISLRGERRTGKTSLLLYLARSDFLSSQKEFENHVLVYFNFQDVTDKTENVIWRAIANAIEQELKQRYSKRQKEYIACFQGIKEVKDDFLVTELGSTLAELGNLGITLHFLFDEFDQTGNNPTLQGSFYDVLRGLPTRTGNLSYVIATRTGLAVLQHIKNKMSSPFFNTFTGMTLSPFNEDDVYRLIHTYFARSGITDYRSLAKKLCAESDFLYELTGYHPFFLQAYCYHLLANLDESGWPKGKAQKLALQKFKEDSEPHFNYYWTISDPEEQEIIRKLSKEQLIEESDDTAQAQIRKLSDHCLVVQVNRLGMEWRLFSSAFQTWVNKSVVFDVFLAHNSKDKDQVEVIAEKLKQRGLIPWLDKEQIPPGRWFQDIVNQALQDVKSAAIFIGSSDLGTWQLTELRGFINQCLTKDIPAIPILLPGIKDIPENLLFLKELNWIAFKTLDDDEAMDNLVWGITGKHPKKISPNK